MDFFFVLLSFNLDKSFSIQAHLSRRLVLEMSADQDKEEQMVTRMRVYDNLFYWFCLIIREIVDNLKNS